MAVIGTTNFNLLHDVFNLSAEVVKLVILLIGLWAAQQGRNPKPKTKPRPRRRR